jgi:protein-S-isoprenylcysteine O-methyltransferase Ste14
MTEFKGLPWRFLRELVFNAILAVSFASLAYKFLKDFQETGRLSSLFYVLFELIVVILAFARRPPKAVSWHLLDWIYALAATVLPLLLTPAPTGINWFWFSVQCVGEAISLIGLLSLNRSLGVVPANRGVKTRGMYRFVRHPIYCGYCIIDVAMVVQNFSNRNITVAVAHLIVQTLRIISEERFLLQDPIYAEYASRVKWRLIPAIW